MRKIYFRADGNSQMGLGHVIRSLALADMLRANFDCYFMIRKPLNTLKHQILEICKGIIELPEPEDDLVEAENIAEQYFDGSEIVVLDGYHFVTNYQQIIKNKGCKLVCIDDIYAYHFVADVVINHAGGVTKEDYSVEPYTILSLGFDYALLRAPFLEAAKRKSFHHSLNDEKNTFVCLGGADPNNNLLTVLQKCEVRDKSGIYYVIIGEAYMYKEELKFFVKNSDLNVNVLSNLSAQDMVYHMKKCRRAITSPSSVSIEYLSVGEILYLNIIAENQRDIFTDLINRKIAFSFEKDFPCYSEVSLNKRIIDGKQKKRLLKIFNALTLQIREATMDDMMLFFEWANEELTRSQSYNPTPIHFDTHFKWFDEKINSHFSDIYILSFEDKPVGQVRFDLDRKKSYATVSYGLDSKFRGRGLGESILRNGISYFRKKINKKIPIIAYVKKTNIPSIKSFHAIEGREMESAEYTNSYKYIIE